MLAAAAVFHKRQIQESLKVLVLAQIQQSTQQEAQPFQILEQVEMLERQTQLKHTTAVLAVQA
jgi:hypothetical protein